jgi:hypothetical protein
MAGLTTDTIVGVDVVTKLSVVRKLMNLDPFNGFSSSPTFANRQKLKRLCPNLTMAVHTSLGSWDIRMVSVLHVGVTILTIESEFANMKTVAVLYRLHRRISNVGILRREVVPNKENDKNAAGYRAEQC